jgi:hypothetical protein
LGAVELAFAGLAAVYMAVARPWFHPWGASEAELRARLPGDEIIPSAPSQETRAITIEASAAAVWAWVSQIGQDRAGFYSYQVLENLVGCEMPNVQTIVPRFQRWKVGDKLWMYPPHKAGGAGFATLVVLEPGRALGFAARQIGRATSDPPDGSWSFIVDPIDDRSSRLIFRSRGAGGLRLVPAFFNLALFEPMHFAMERRTMTSIKELAEGRRPSAEADALQVVLWVTVFFGCLVAAGATIRARRFGQPLAAFVVLGLLFQLLTFVQPPPALGVALFIALAATPWGLIRWSVRRRAASQGLRAQVG